MTVSGEGSGSRKSTAAYRQELIERAEREKHRFATDASDLITELVDAFRPPYEALAGIANADTKYPSMPSGFTGDWEVLRDEARSVLTEDEDGVWC